MSSTIIACRAKMDFYEVIIECIKEGAKIWQKHRNLPQEEKNKKACQWFGTGASNHVPRLPTAANRHKRNAEDCKDNGQDLITTSKPFSKREGLIYVQYSYTCILPNS